MPNLNRNLNDTLNRPHSPESVTSIFFPEEFVMKLDPNKWFGNIEKAALLLSKGEIARKVRYGYCRCEEPTLENVLILGLLVLIRTFLGWSLVIEIEERWPWQPSGMEAEGSHVSGKGSDEAHSEKKL